MFENPITLSDSRHLRAIIYKDQEKCRLVFVFCCGSVETNRGKRQIPTRSTTWLYALQVEGRGDGGLDPHSELEICIETRTGQQYLTLPGIKSVSLTKAKTFLSCGMPDM